MTAHTPLVHLDDLEAARERYDQLEDYTGLTDVALRRKIEPAGGLYIAESQQVIRRALAAGHKLRSVLIAPKWLPKSEDIVAAAQQQGVPMFVASEECLEQLTGFHLHRGALASMHRPKLADASTVMANARRVVVLEDIVDHTNVGAIFRACAGFGVDAVLVTPRCADPLYRRSIRVSMGTVFQVPWTRIEPWPLALQNWSAQGWVTAALALTERATSLDTFSQDLPDRLALVLGTEGDGLGARTLANVDTEVVMPMSGGVDSLNVAAAAAVAIWETRVRS